MPLHKQNILFLHAPHADMNASAGRKAYRLISPATQSFSMFILSQLYSHPEHSRDGLCKIRSETTSSLIESVDLLDLWVAVQTNCAGSLQRGSSTASQHTHTQAQKQGIQGYKHTFPKLGLRG